MLFRESHVKGLRYYTAIMPLIPTDKELVDMALALAEQHKGKQIREVLPGVTEHDVSRWRREGVERLTGEKRDALLRFRDRHYVPDPGESDASNTPSSPDERRRLREEAEREGAEEELDRNANGHRPSLWRGW